MRSSVRRGSVYVVTLVLLALGLRAGLARAFCGFFAGVSDAGMVNSSTQTVIVRECDFTTLTLAFNYRGDPGEFTVVFPVPVVLTEHDVRVVDRELIQRLDTFTAPRAVRFFGCGRPCVHARGRGRGGGGSGELDESVVVEAEFVAGEYEIVILSANESGALFAWLADQGFQLPDHAPPILQRYIDKGMRFLAAKVTLEAQAREGFAFLSPLQMTFESQNFCLPILMGTINADSEQDLLIYTIAAGAEVQVENYPTLRLDRSADYQPADWASFNEFVTAQFDATRAGADLKVVTEYVGPVNKGDPPTTDPITREELRQLGYRGETTPHVTRLHLRYSPEQVVDDLQFTMTPPLFFTPNFTRLPEPPDCNGNGIPDPTDITDGLAGDCNGNGVPDSCDLADGASRDCNGNDVPDSCDLADGTLLDRDGNRIRDACEKGDFDRDGDVDLADYLVFMDCFTGAGGVITTDAPCSLLRESGGPGRGRSRDAPGDFDDDGDVDFADLLAFQARFTGAR